METKSFRDTLLRGIALLGLILVLVLGAWGIIVLAFNAPNILSSAGQTIAGLFGGEREEETDEETDEEDGETVEVPVVSSAPSTPAKPTSTQAPTVGAGYTYTPAPQPVVQLYGYADLAVRIISVVPQGSRYSMHFEVSNIGTNVAPTGWSFVAQLPLEPTYTYNSGPQQALRPGDKIVYTMGFDMSSYNYNYDYCDRWDDNDDEWYDYDCDRRYDRDYRDNRVTVIANPYGTIYELNRFNNSASQTIPLNYYPTYPTPTYPYYPQYPYLY
ncbi:MAG: hypothetical protein U1C66_02405 [Patescibacteria group bacterium]|nr:hypothetical protein [Patescibacteria group bacterium]